MTTRVVLDQAAISRMFHSASGPVARELTKKTIQVEGAAIRLCPVDTGRLRSSISHQVTVDGQGLVGYVGTSVNYAIFVELGTRFMPAQPYLRPALRAAT